MNRLLSRNRTLSETAFAFARITHTLSGGEPFKTGYDKPETATANESELAFYAAGSVGTLAAPSGDDVIGQTYELTCLTRTPYLTDRVFFIATHARIAKASTGVINDTSSSYSYQNAPSVMYSQPSSEACYTLPHMEVQAYIETCAFQSVGASAASGTNYYNTYPTNPEWHESKPLLFGWVESSEKMYYVNTSNSSLSVPAGYGSGNSFVVLKGYSLIFVNKQVRDQFHECWNKLGWSMGQVWSVDEVQDVLDKVAGCACRLDAIRQVFLRVPSELSEQDRFELLLALVAKGTIGASSYYPDMVRIFAQVGKVSFTSTSLAAASTSEPYGGISAPSYMTQPALYAGGALTSRFRFVATHFLVALSSSSYICAGLSVWYGGVPGSEASRSPFNINAKGYGWNPERIGSTAIAAGDSSVVMRQATLGRMERLRQLLLFGGNKQREGLYISNGWNSSQTIEATILFKGFLLEFATSQLASRFDEHVATLATISRVAPKAPEIDINKLSV